MVSVALVEGPRTPVLQIGSGGAHEGDLLGVRFYAPNARSNNRHHPATTRNQASSQTSLTPPYIEGGPFVRFISRHVRLVNPQPPSQM